jgi:hypothetical protein
MLVVRCELCKAVAENMNAIEINIGTAEKGPSDLYVAHCCQECWKKHDVGSLLHKLTSLGFRHVPKQPRVVT